jgi:hypothetical protein
MGMKTGGLFLNKLVRNLLSLSLFLIMENIHHAFLNIVLIVYLT